jgi:hypothetical protein
MTSQYRSFDETFEPARQRAERATNGAIDRLSDRAAHLRDEAAPVIDRVAERASDLARESAHWVQDRGERLREQAARASDRTVGYVREEPLRATLMAMAAGALIYALVRMARGSSRY